jgi:cell division protease FtsH
MNRTIKTILFWAIIVVSALLLWQVVRSSPEDQRTPEISYSQFISKVEAGEISRVDIAGSRIRGQYRDGTGAFRLIGPSNPAVFLDTLRSKGVEIWFKDVPGDNLPLQLLGTWAPLILLGALWFFMIRQMRLRSAARDGARTPDVSGEVR